MKLNRIKCLLLSDIFHLEKRGHHHSELNEKRDISLLSLRRQTLRRPEDGPGGAGVGSGPAQRHPFLRRQGRQPGGLGQRALVL